MDNNSSDNKVRGPSIRLSTVATSTRQTPKTDFGTVMRNGLVTAGNVVADGLAVAAPFVPGGAIVSAALAGGHAVATDAGMGGGGGVVYSAPYGGGASYGAGQGTTGMRNAAFGTTGAALTGGAGPAGTASASPGSYPGGTLALPGARPGLTTNLSQSPNDFSGTSGATVGAGSSDAFNQMMASTRQMSEFQASFNLQYLQLQEKIQIDSRQFNLVSNIMKTKHDAAKNALNNVR
jgi:hypothetical protein